MTVRRIGLIGLAFLLTCPLFADYVEIGSEGGATLNRPFCGT